MNAQEVVIDFVYLGFAKLSICYVFIRDKVVHRGLAPLIISLL